MNKNLAFSAVTLLFASSLAHASADHATRQMIEAASVGDLAQVQALLRSGAELNGKDSGGNTALHWASLECRLDVVRFLASQPAIELNARDNANETPFTEAATAGCLDVVKFLASTPGIDLNAVNFRGQSALISATHIPRTEVSVYLASLPGVDVNVVDSSKITPAWAAATTTFGGSVAILKALVARHANLEVIGGWDQRTPLGEASAMGHLKVVKYLVSVGANRLAKDAAGNLPADVVCDRWQGLSPENGGEDCPRAEILRALK